jgi:hypothetical protein
MDQFPVDVEPAVESQLIDLGEVPLSALRELDGAMLHRSLRYAVNKTKYLLISAAGEPPSERPIDSGG